VAAELEPLFANSSSQLHALHTGAAKSRTTILDAAESRLCPRISNLEKSAWSLAADGPLIGDQHALLRHIRPRLDPMEQHRASLADRRIGLQLVASIGVGGVQRRVHVGLRGLRVTRVVRVWEIYGQDLRVVLPLLRVVHGLTSILEGQPWKAPQRRSAYTQ